MPGAAARASSKQWPCVRPLSLQLPDRVDPNYRHYFFLAESHAVAADKVEPSILVIVVPRGSFSVHSAVQPSWLRRSARACPLLPSRDHPTEVMSATSTYPQLCSDGLTVAKWLSDGRRERPHIGTGNERLGEHDLISLSAHPE
jgi:hypothetical protein